MCFLTFLFLGVEEEHPAFFRIRDLAGVDGGSHIHLFRGRHLVLINRTPTPMDRKADLVITDSIGKTLEAFL